MSAADAGEFAVSHALIVGVDAYSGGIPVLGNAVRDARAIADLLERDHGFRVTRLLDDAATRDALTAAFGDLLPSIVGADDRVFVYFAGHGIAQDGDDGPEGFLVPVDAPADDRRALLSMIDVHRALSALPCRHLLLVLDCCFAGSFRWAATRSFLPASQPLYRKRYQRFVEEPAWQVLTSTAPDQKALDLLDGLTIGTRATTTDHSPFALALLDGLAGGADRPGPDGATDGVVTATELYLHVRDVVELGAEAAGKAQTPGLWPLARHGRGEFLFHVPGRELALLPDPPLDAAANPWPGLAAYDEGRAELFFGRSRVVTALRARLDAPSPLIAVLGASGTGKSSVVRAGLSAWARTEEGWAVVGPVRPGESPLAALDELESGLAETPITDSVLLLLDQFEEIYTLCRDAQVREAFLVRLDALLVSLPERARMVLTARSDFLPQLRASPLGPRLDVSQFIVPPMTTDELREVIEGPAQVRVLYFEPPELVDRLVDAVVSMPGALPLLSFTLSELYVACVRSGRDDRALRAEDYDAMGGVVGSLRSRASQLYDSANAEGRRAIERVMVRMVALDGGELAKRRVSLRELEYRDPAETAEARAVIERFTEARLFLRSGATSDPSSSITWVDGEPDQDSWVEPTHDMLVIAWDRVHLWLDDIGPEVHLQRAVWRQAAEWGEEDRARAALWHDDPRLGVLQAIRRRPGHWLNGQEEAFVQASVRRRDRNARVVRWSIVAFVLVALGGLTGISILAAKARSEANEAIAARAQAEEERDRALKLTKLAGAQTARDPTTAAVLLREVGAPDGLPLWSFAVNDAVSEPIARQVFQSHRGAVTSASFSPGGARVLTTSEDGSAVIAPIRVDGATALALETEGGPHLVIHAPGPVLAGGWSPDGARVVIGTESGAVQVVDAATGETLRTLRHGDGPALDVSWSLDGAHIAATGGFGGLLVWSAGTFAIERELLLPPDVWGVDLDWLPDNASLAVAGTNAWAAFVPLVGDPVLLAPPPKAPDVDWISVATSPDGDHVALAGEAGQAGLWDRAGRQIAEMNSPRGFVRRIAWSPEGGTVATGGGDHIVRVWSAGGTLRHALKGHSGAILDLAFSPTEPGLLFSASLDNTVRSWGTRYGLPLLLFRGHMSGVRRVQVRADGQRFVTASGDWTARLWSPHNASETVELPNVGAEIRDARFSPTCAWIAVGMGDGLVRLFEAPGRGPPLATALQGVVTQLAFSPDGSWLAAGTLHGELMLRRCAAMNAAGTDCARWSERAQVLADGGPGDGVEAIAWGGDPLILVTANEDEEARVRFLGEGSTLNPTMLHSHTQPLSAVDVSADGRRIATGARDQSVTIWDPAQPGAPLARWDDLGGRVRKVAFSPDGTHLAIVTSSSAVLVRALDGPLRELGRHQGHVTDAAWSADGTRLLTGASSHDAAVWEVGSGAKLHTLRGHTGPISFARWAADDAGVLTGSLDTTVRTWALSPGVSEGSSEVVEVYTGAISALSAGCTSGQLLSGSSDGDARNSQIVGVAQMRRLLAVVTDYCVPPGETQALLGTSWTEASEAYDRCVAAKEQRAGAPQSP